MGNDNNESAAMHPKLENRVRYLLRQFCKHAVLRNGQWRGDGAEAREDIDDLTNTLAASYKDEINRQTGFTVVLSQLINALEASGASGSGPLLDVMTEEQVWNLCDYFVGWWDTLPRPVEIRIPLPRLNPKYLPIDLGPSMSLVTSSWIRSQVVSDERPFAELSFGQPARPDGMIDIATLVVKTKGFVIGFTGTDTALTRALFAARVLLQIGYCLELFDKRPSGSDDTCTNGWAVDQHEPNSPTEVFVTFPSVIAQTLRSTEWSYRLPNQSENSYRASIEDKCQIIGKIIGWLNQPGLPEPEGVKDTVVTHANRIAIASVWLHESMSNPKDASRVIRTSIALETLYGGKTGDGVISTLSNRLAYAIGRDPDDRDLLVKKFNKFYEMRSKVVHSGHLNLDDHQVDLLNWAEATAYRAIRHETQMLLD